jgi:hypothetical protein
LPHAGAPARIVHFGGSVEQATVVAVHEDGRRLEVRDEAGDVLEFVLNRATARFVAFGASRGPRLEFVSALS